MRVGCYVRVSTQEQAKEGYSIPEQTERLKSYCSAMGWTVFKVYTDAGFSGANTNRPAMQELIKDIEAHLIEKVVVYKLDRLSRSQKDTLFLIEDVFLAHGCDFVSMRENFDTSTPFGKAMIGILAVFAQLEREQIKERMQMGRDARAKLGLFHGSKNNPIGYNYHDGHLTINEFEAVQIKRIFEAYAEGMSCQAIATMLNDAGLTCSPSGWNRKTVRYALMSKVYIGMIPHKGEWYQGEHEGIISEDLFKECESIRLSKGEYKGRFNGRNGNASSLLSGMVYCAHCGAHYSKMTKTLTLKSGEKRKYIKYICNSKAKRSPELVKDPKCKNKTWKMEELDALIIGELEKLSLNPEIIDEARPEPNKNELLEPISAKIEQVEKQISRLMDLYALDEIPLESLQSKIQELHQQRSKLKLEYLRISAEHPKSLSKDVAMEKVHSFFSMASRGTLDDLRGILKILISKIEIDGDDVTIFWNF